MEHSLDELMAGLADPDPAVRDGWAYEELAGGIASGRFADDHERILAVTTARTGHADAWTRSFAPLVLAWLADAGTFDRDAFDTFARWYVAEEDTRGYDARYGWLHPVAHGADLLGVCVARGLVPADEALGIIAARLVAPGTPWRHQEDARLARVVVTAVARSTATAEQPRWVADIHDALDRYEQSPPPGEPAAWLHNTSTTCAKAHLALTLADATDRQLRDVHRTALAGVVTRVEPYVVP